MTASEQQLLGEIKTLFSEFKCTLQDLRNPTEEFVMSFYSYFLQEFEVDLSSINQVQFSQGGIIKEYQDSYALSISKINMLKCIRTFGIVKDFGMLDLVSPAPKRTQEIIRALLNFYSWSDERVAEIIEKRKEVAERMKKLVELAQNKEQLRQQLNSISMEIPRIQDETKELEDQLSAAQQILAEKKVEANKYNEDTAAVEQIVKKEESLLHKLFQEELKLRNNIDDLSNKIVDSPSAILTEVDILRDQNNKTGELRSEKRDMLESKMKANELLSQMTEELKERAVVLDELLTLVNQQREFKSVASAAQQDKKASQEMLTELKSLLLVKQTKKKNSQEQLQSLYLQWKTLKPQLIESVECAMRDLKNIKKSQESMTASLMEVVETQELIKSKTEKIRTFNEKFLRDYELFNKPVDEIFEGIKTGAIYQLKEATQEFEKRFQNRM